MPATLGIVPYTNVLPLLEGLEETFPRSHWVRATPRELSGLLAAGEVDIALISVFEGLRMGYRMLPGAAIGCLGPVRSVAIYSKVPLPFIRTVLLDRASLSSVNLAQVLCRELLSITPEFSVSESPFQQDFDWEHCDADAFVVIGDTALAWENCFPHKLDLGAGWRLLTGLPFVFAGWYLRQDSEISPAEADAFRAAREQGTANAAAIARREFLRNDGFPGGLPEMISYLTKTIRYELGPKELEATALFREKCIRHGLLPGDSALPEIWTPAASPKSDLP